jgi:hypothetical protein
MQVTVALMVEIPASATSTRSNWLYKKPGSKRCEQPPSRPCEQQKSRGRPVRTVEARPCRVEARINESCWLCAGCAIRRVDGVFALPKPVS